MWHTFYKLAQLIKNTFNESQVSYEIYIQINRRRHLQPALFFFFPEPLLGLMSTKNLIWQSCILSSRFWGYILRSSLMWELQI